ncbi:uncharacterized protein LOC144158292 isoform X1 [Haemaphysalis longicornis]
MKLLPAMKLLRASSTGAPCVLAKRCRATRVVDDARTASKPRVVLAELRVQPLRSSSVVRVRRLPCSVEVSAADVGDAATATLLGARPQLFLGGESPVAFSADADGAELTMAEGAPQPTAPRSDLLCLLRVPFMTSLEVELCSCAHVTLQDVVLDRCRVRVTGSATIGLSGVKANELRLASVDGSVKAMGAVQGNLEVAIAGSGGFEAQRLLAHRLKVETSGGSQRVSAVYVEEVELSAGEGSVHLGTLHSQEAWLATRTGAVTVGGLDGGSCRVATATGDVSVTVARARHLDVTTDSGNVTLQLPSACHVTVDAPAVESDLDSSTPLAGGCSGEEAHISARSGSGRIVVKKQDWVSSLNLGGQPTSA